jgi:hypothetical protein
MKQLALKDCIRSTPSRTLVAVTRELSFRARRSFARTHGGNGHSFSEQAHDETVPAWTQAPRATAADGLSSQSH